MTNMPAKKASVYPININNCGHTLIKSKSKNMICRNTVSLTTNGVNAAIVRTESDILSNGMIVDDKNNNTVQTVIEARTYVSSDLKK